MSDIDRQPVITAAVEAADFELNFTLHHPITDEEWDAITDVGLDHTDNIFFHTKNGKEVEFVKRKKGKWVSVGGYATPGGDPVWVCSECGKGLHVYGIEHGTYGKDVADGQWVACPNCGARMEEG